MNVPVSPGKGQGKPFVLHVRGPKVIERHMMWRAMLRFMATMNKI